MTYTKLSDQLFLYTFTGEKELNIPLLVNGTKVLFIDTGYTEEGQELHEFLQKEGLDPEIIVHSHYHPDHFYGNHIFSQCIFMGSEHYKQNFELFEALNTAHNYIPPTKLISNGDTLQYGSFDLKFFNLPGHSIDTIVTLINDKFLHVGDLIMLSNDGKHHLPYLTFDGSIEQHIDSLKQLQTLPATTLIPAHGQVLEGKEAINQAIELRIHYLQRLKEFGNQAKVEDCLLKPLEQYERISFFHENNLKNTFGVLR